MEKILQNGTSTSHDKTQPTAITVSAYYKVILSCCDLYKHS
ncbi:hypothetical protein [Flavobacterium aquiphilum]|nr:hypothetical protein [Flavobacterium aquiphilum]